MAPTPLPKSVLRRSVAAAGMLAIGAAGVLAFDPAASVQAAAGGFRGKPSQPLAGRNSGFAQTNFARFPRSNTPLPNVPANRPRP